MLSLNRHPETWIPPEQSGLDFPPYRKTFDFPGEFIDSSHAAYARATSSGLIETGIPGWLRPADALKLYEMAYFSQGPILELGAYQGLSTSILAQGQYNAGHARTIVSMDSDSAALDQARLNLGDLAKYCNFVPGDARITCDRLKQNSRTFWFAFVDHSHSYELVYTACVDVKTLIVPGGFALFHDFNDPRNGKDPNYGVYQAVVDAFSDDSFVFYGIYGCTGLYRRSDATNRS